MVGREKPEMPCDQILNEQEWRVLSAWAMRIPAQSVH
jgi:hypothetical protein